MAKIVRSVLADRDLVTIWKYIARDNVDAATSLLRKIDSTIIGISNAPMMGRSRVEGTTFHNMRSFPIGNYVIFYRPLDDSGIEIVRVLHGKLDFKSQFGE